MLTGAESVGTGAGHRMARAGARRHRAFLVSPKTLPPVADQTGHPEAREKLPHPWARSWVGSQQGDRRRAERLSWCSAQPRRASKEYRAELPDQNADLAQFGSGTGIGDIAGAGPRQPRRARLAWADSRRGR